MKPIRLWLAQDKDESCSLYHEYPSLDYEETFYYSDNGGEIKCKEKNILGEVDLAKCVVILESEYKQLKGEKE